MTKKTAVITGVTGQDGAYLTQLLLGKGYQVFGAYRRVSTPNFWRLEELKVASHKNLTLVEFDLTDPSSCINLLSKTQPDELYNLAAQSFVKLSFEQPSTTSQISGIGVLNLLEAIRIVSPATRFYQASTSEMFGKVQHVPQSEETPFYPRSPYGVAKLYAHWMAINYRESHDIFASNGILFNHESPLRGIEFVTRKITDAVAQLKKGTLDCLELGNIDAKRDWGFAGDFVDGIWRMLQADQPGDYVLSTGRTETVRSFLQLAFKYAGIKAEFSGSGIDEIATDVDTNKVILRINSEFYRPAEVDLLIGDPTKAKKELGWETTTSLEELCAMMVAHDFKCHDIKQESHV